MRIWIAMVIILAGAGWVAVVHAETMHGLEFQAASIYGERQAPPESVRHEYLSQGQDYLRQYVRENLRRFISDSGVALDINEMQASATVNLNTLALPGPAGAQASIPVENKFRIWAAEDLNDYLHCGRFVPLHLELESQYHMGSNLDFSARLRAPLDNVMQIELGSQFHWTEEVVSRWQYTMHNNSELYGNLNLGLGIQWRDWQVALDYDVTPQLIQQQRLSLGKNF
jgi:hypothetical protein